MGVKELDMRCGATILLCSTMMACMALSSTEVGETKTHHVVRSVRKANADKMKSLSIDANGDVGAENGNGADGDAAAAVGMDALVKDYAINKAGDATPVEIQTALHARTGNEPAFEARSRRMQIRFSDWRLLEYSEMQDYRRLCEEHYDKMMVSEENIKNVMDIAIKLVSQAVPLFMAVPMKLVGPGGALELFQTELWRIVELLVPDNVKNSQTFSAGKTAWDAAFQSGTDIKMAVEDFKRTGNTFNLINNAVVKIIQRALNVAAQFWPKGDTIFNAIIELLSDIANAWQKFAEKKWAEGADLLYEAMKNCIDDIAPANFKASAAYKWIMGSLDATLGNMQETVIKIKKALMSKRICRKMDSFHRQKVGNGFPTECPEGFEYLASTHSCYPPQDKGGPCLEDCGRAGACTHYCGKGKACCKRFDPNEPCECVHAGMHKPGDYYANRNNVDQNGKWQTPNDYHQCVEIGPCKMQDGKCSNIDSPPSSNASSFGEVDYQLALDQSLEGKNDAKAKNKAKKKKPAQMKTASTKTASTKPYSPPATCMDPRVFLQEEVKNSDVPRSVALTHMLADLDSDSLDGTMSKKGNSGKKKNQGGDDDDDWTLTAGTTPADCKIGEKVNAKCYQPCKPGFTPSENKLMCDQVCKETTFPVASPKNGQLCAMTVQDHETLQLEFIQMLTKTITNAAGLGLEIKANGFNPEHLKKITSAIVDFALPFLRPECKAKNKTGVQTGGVLLTDGSVLLTDGANDIDMYSDAEEGSDTLSAKTTHLSAKATYQKAAEVFQRFDVNMDGSLSAEEIQKAADTWNTDFPNLEDHVMMEIDADRDSNVSFHEFLGWLKKEGVMRHQRDSSEP